MGDISTTAVASLMKLSKLLPETRNELPLIPLRDLVVFPHSVIPFFVGRRASLRALDAAMSADREILLAFQRTPIDKPSPEDLYPIATLARVVQVLKIQNDENVRVMVEGCRRVGVKKIRVRQDVSWAQYVHLEENPVKTWKWSVNWSKSISKPISA